jgi:hypothetical protein
LLDVSPAQHELARERLKSLGARVSFVERDFKQPTWNAGLGPFDAVVALFCAQTSHGLRDPRQDVALHTQVRSVLSPIGVYLLADYVPGSEEIDGDPPAQPGEEQEQNLKDAGFARVERLVERSGVVLYAAR